MSEQRTSLPAAWAAFMTPIAFVAPICVPGFLDWPGRPPGWLFETGMAMMPYGFILLALAVTTRSMYLRITWSVFWLTLLSCGVVSASPWLGHSVDGRLSMLGGGVVGLGAVVALVIGPITFLLGASLLWSISYIRFPADNCHDCGYDLTGLKPGAVCPECGKPIPGAPI